MDINDSSKRVKFAFEQPNSDEEGNDLDLDTIRASKNKSKGLKEFDSEGSGSEGSEAEENELELELSESEDGEAEKDDSDSEIDERQVPLMPFSLKADREEGNFDSEGFYTRKQDEEADQDRWMANFTLTDIVKARKAHEEREKLTKEKDKTIERRSEGELWEELAGLLMETDLTVIETIRQLTNKQEPQKPRAPLNKNRLKKLQKEQQQQQSAEIKADVILDDCNKTKMERITELADGLMDFGNFGVYEETRRSILRKINK